MGQQFVVICLEDLTAERTGVLLTEKYKKLVQVFPIGIAEFALVPPVRAASAAEKLLRAVSEARLIGGNHEFATMNDFEGIQEAKGVFLCKVFPCEGDSADLYRAWISDGFSLKCFETRELSPTGSPAYFENTVVGNVESGFLVGIWAMRRNVTERKILEEALRDESEKLAAYSQSLESQVRDRTSHLEASQRSLEDYARKLEAANEALRVLIDGVERQKKDRERRLIDAFKFVAKPLLDQVRAQGLPRETLNMIDSLEAGLEKVVSSWSSDRVKNWELLTLREIRICEMIASGLTSKEIARIMGVSPQTIFCHRTNIRKKLGLSGTEDQLASRLRNPGR
jgi:DNA-binding CsgD family transcriptional regulator